MTPILNASGRSPKASVERGATIARKYKMHDVADRVQNLVNAKYRTSSVVIIGEVKRGKSSLVNALIGRRDLLPVDVITATSAPPSASTLNPTSQTTSQSWRAWYAARSAIRSTRRS